MKLTVLRRTFRVLTLAFLAALGTCLLMYTAPGYFTEASEMDAQHAGAARASLGNLHKGQATLPRLLKSQVLAWAHGDLGESRQYAVPVKELLQEKWRSSATLLLSGLALGWSMALLAAVPLSLLRSRGLDIALALSTAALLAAPVGALATVCVVTGFGSPALVLGLLVAVRDFKLLHKMLHELWTAPHLLHARAQGLSLSRLLASHVLFSLHRDLLSLLALSFTLCLSALVPVEVVFDRVGLGQLAWSAAMNRDLPVLVTITALMALGVGVAEVLSGASTRKEADLCV